MSDWFVEEDLLPGETIKRRYKKTYPQIVAPARASKGPIDFSVCGQLQKMLMDKMFMFGGWKRDMLQDAFTHLSDAMNEGLPLEVRETHFDIAGSLVWNTDGTAGLPKDLHDWMLVWMRAGGL